MFLQDLLNEFQRVAEIKKSELYGLQSGGRLTDRSEKLLRAIEKRLAGHRKNSKNEDMTLNQMLHHFNARLCKPQRLVSLTYEEEERRALRSWNRFAFAKNFKPEWCNIQLWMTILEQVFPDMIGYNVEHLEVLMKWSDSGIIGLLRFLEKTELSPPSRRAVANASVIIRQITD